MSYPDNGRTHLSATGVPLRRYLVVAVAACLSPVANAQLEEVVVTAQKRAESLQDVPVTLQAFSNDALEDFGIGDTQSLQYVTPGLVINNTGSTPAIYLRGVGTRLSFPGLEPSVATYVDDRYLGRPNGTVFEFADIERIEVLKGPQGTLYGRNATGGAVRVVTLDVTEELEGKIVGSAGNYDALGVSGTVNIPVTDTLGVRLSGLTRQRDGFADNLDPRGASELDDQDYQAWRAKVRWDISETWTARFTLEGNQRDDLEGADVVALSPPELHLGLSMGGITGNDVDEVATATRRTIDYKDTAATLRLDAAFDTVDFAAITTYWDYDQTGSLDADGTSTRLVDVVNTPVEGDSFSQEFQLLSNAAENYEWIVGAFYYEETVDHYDLILGLQDNPRVGTSVSQGNQGADTQAYALYGQFSYDFSPNWSLTLGGRYSVEDKDISVMAPIEVPVSLAPHPYEDSDSWNEFTPKATLEYNFDAGLVYASYARGFKSGGFNYVASTSNPLTGEPLAPLDPEILDMFELGWKAELFDRSLRLNGALFYYDYQDLQVTRAVADPDTGSVVNLTENAANAELYGLDLDLTWLPTDALMITMGLNLLQSEYQDFVAAANVYRDSFTPGAAGMQAIAFDADGQDLLRAPDWSAFVSASYDISLAGQTFPLVVTYSYKDDYNFDFVADPSTERLVQEGYGLLSARLGWLSPNQNWELAVWGKNLTDEDDYFDDIVASAPGIRGSHGAPRTYGIDISYSF